MQRVVLDASALIALIYEEKGAAEVEKHLAHALISTVNMAEVASYLVMQEIDIKTAEQLLEDLAIEVVDYNLEQVFLTAGLRAKTKNQGLSLGDRACLSLAIIEKLPVLTADKVWAKLDLGIKIHLIR